MSALCGLSFALGGACRGPTRSAAAAAASLSSSARLLPWRPHYFDVAFTMLALELAALGFAAVGLDLPGHGRSCAKTADDLSHDIESFEGDFVDTFLQLIDEAVVTLRRSAGSVAGEAKDDSSSNDGVDASPAPAPLPVFLFGESMGGAVCALTSKRRPGFFAGMVLHSPMAGINDEQMPPSLVVSCLKCMSKCCPTAQRVPKTEILPECFVDPEHVDFAINHNPYPIEGNLRLRFALELLNASKAIQGDVASFTTPMLVAVSDNDVVVDPASAVALYEGASATDKTLLRFKQAKHSIFWAPSDIAAAFVRDCLTWIVARVEAGDGGGAAAGGGGGEAVEVDEEAATALTSVHGAPPQDPRLRVSPSPAGGLVVDYPVGTGTFWSRMPDEVAFERTAVPIGTDAVVATLAAQAVAAAVAADAGSGEHDSGGEEAAPEGVDAAGGVSSA